MKKIDIDLLKENTTKYRIDCKKSCSQSTFVGICTGINREVNEKKLFPLAAGFAGGIGRTFDEGTCGALIGGVMALGACLPEEESYKIIQHSKELYQSFKDKYGTVACGNITKKSTDISPCLTCCLFVAEKVGEILEKEKSE